MNPETARRLPDLLAEMLERPPEQWDAFLAEACGGDQTLRAEVLSLAGCQSTSSEFLETPAYVHPDAAMDGLSQGELKPGETLGDCKILELIGEGGMGEVYLADDTRLGRRVAVKLLKRHLHDALAQRFRQEQRVLAGLTHPGVARLYDASVADGRAYLVMEYVEGEPLDRFCDNRRLSIGERLTLFRKICAAVSYAHQNLVVHRDLKPANIRVTPEGEPKLLDFGIAKLIDPQADHDHAQTVTQYAAMTPGYASPEQLRGEPVNTASDVYSLGVVLYELLTGQRAYQFVGKRPDLLARAICEQDPPRPSTLVSRRVGVDQPATEVGGEPPGKLRRLLEGDLDNIVALAMRKEPERRYASVAQFSDDIRRHCEGLPVLARKDTLPYRTGKFVGRNKVAVAAGVLVALSLVGGLAAVSWQVQVTRKERDTARVALRQAERMDEFLQNLLRSADQEKMGKDVKVVQVLDAAGKDIDRELADEPDVLARVHESLSFVYAHLGQIEPSGRHMRAALEIRRRVHGEDDPETMRAEMWMASALGNEGNFAEAEPFARQSLAGRQRQSPPDLYWTARAGAMLGAILGQLHRPQEAEAVLQQALSLMRTARGENNKDYIDTLYFLGCTKLSAGRRQEAEVDLRRAIAFYDQYTPHYMGGMDARLMLAICLFQEQRPAEAEQVVQRLETDIRQLVGDDEVMYARARLVRACLDFAKGNDAAVIEEVRRPLELIVSATPSDHQTIAEARGLLGLALTRTGKAVEGEPFLRAAYAEGKDLEDRTLDLTIGNASSALGECLLVQDRHEEAEPLLLAGLDQLGKRLGTQHPMTVQASNRLRELYSTREKSGQAAENR